MNDKDKEAFEKWFNESEQVKCTNPELLTEKVKGQMFILWQAACEYKQKEVNFFKDKNETNISKATCINQVNDGLHILLKEAEAENKKLREALEFYADWKSWKPSKHEIIEDYFGEARNDWSVVEYIEKDGDKFKSAFNGKRAREALKEVGEE